MHAARCQHSNRPTIAQHSADSRWVTSAVHDNRSRRRYHLQRPINMICATLISHINRHTSYTKINRIVKAPKVIRHVLLSHADLQRRSLLLRLLLLQEDATAMTWLLCAQRKHCVQRQLANDVAAPDHHRDQRPRSNYDQRCSETSGIPCIPVASIRCKYCGTSGGDRRRHCTLLEMLARLRAGQRDGRHHQADDDFGGWVKTTVLF